MFGWDFEVGAWSRFWICLIKICVRICDMTSRNYFGKQNSTLGSVVPLAILFRLTWFIHPMIFKAHVSKQFWFFSSLRSNSALIIFLVHSLHTCISIPAQGNILCLIIFWRFFSDLVMSFNNPLDIKNILWDCIFLQTSSTDQQQKTWDASLQDRALSLAPCKYSTCGWAKKRSMISTNR